MFSRAERKRILGTLHRIAESGGYLGKHGALRRAVREWLTAGAKANGESVQKVLGRHAGYLERLASKAGHEFPELAMNYKP